MMVTAPGLFSIMTVAPRSFAIPCASVRAITSVPPPGANGTTILTILSGYNAEGSSGENAVSNNTASANRKGAVLVLRSGSMGTARGWSSGNAPADHACRRSAMRRAASGYDAGYASGDGGRGDTSHCAQHYYNSRAHLL